MTNINNKNARNCIQNALLQLMETKKFDKITITDIIQLAHVSRTTYYYHYYTQRDILDEIINYLVKQIFSSQEIDSLSRHSLEKLSQCLLDSIYENRSAIKALLSSDVADVFKSKYHDHLESFSANLIIKLPIGIEQHHTYFDYFFSGHYQMITDWVLDDCKIPTKEYVQTLNKISALFTPCYI